MATSYYFTTHFLSLLTLSSLESRGLGEQATYHSFNTCAKGRYLVSAQNNIVAKPRLLETVTHNCDKGSDKPLPQCGDTT